MNEPKISLRGIFNEAVELTDAAERTAFLQQACGNNTNLRRRIKDLLQAHERAGGFLEAPTPVSGLNQQVAGSLPLTEKPGGRIGRYKLLQQIGEGGCGVVYLAEQEEPVRRRVALKIIKLGMDTKSVIARFEAERQALALMDHPNIAKVLDAGATDTGRPYFVMELVRGIKITDYCDQNNLSTEERLKLFIQVCQAIQHAHQKGIIHRDIKPSNILVTISEPGSPGCPKVIDFGIAKATTDQRLTDKTVFTAFEQFIGTPAYMSPEQAMMTSLDVDTRTDIYALGVLLYELLTGQTPFDQKELLAAGLDEMRRTVREKEPLKPSTRLTQELAAADARKGKPGENQPSASSRRRLQELVHFLRGDLDWIVMKCLEKDRARRYETANGIAADIQRHLKHEPVTARPPSRLYLLQKMAQRNRGALVATATVLVALLVAVLALATSNARIRQERNQKDVALRERGTALEAARASEERAREQLFVSLQSQAQARRYSRQKGQRLESLAVLAEAARIRPDAELRDSAIAAMAIPDIEHGPVWRGWNADTKAITYDSMHQRYARFNTNGTIIIRTIPDDHELQHLKLNPQTEAGVAAEQFTFSPDGQFLALLDQRGQLGVWRWQSGEFVLKHPPGNCAALAFSPDGKQVAVGHEDWITCYELSTGEAGHQWRAQDRIYAMDFHPDNRRLAVGYHDASVVAVYNANKGERVANFPTEGSSQTVVAWHPDGELLATGGSDSRIHIWDVNTSRPVALLEGHFQQVNFLRFHWSGEFLASMSWDGTMRLWQPAPGRLLMRLPSRWMGFSREGQWAGVISPSTDQAQLWRIIPSQEYQTFLNSFGDGESTSREGDISPDGTLLALAASDGVRLWDVARGREVAWLRMNDTMCALFRAGGHELLTCGPVDGVRRWGIEASMEPEGGWQLSSPRAIALPFAPLRITKGRDDRTLAVLGEQVGKCVLLDLVTELVRGAALPHEMVAFSALSENAQWLATGGWHSKRVKLWDIPGGKLIKEWDVGSSARVFFTPDNREMIMARDREFTFYDLKTLEVSRRMAREIGLFPGLVAFTADGKLMALEMAPGLIHLKEVTSGRTVAKLEDPQGDQSTWMSLTPDGTQLVVVARFAGAIHRWDLRAIRARLKTMNLDWDWPEFAAPVGEPSLPATRRPLRVQVSGLAVPQNESLK